MNQALTGEGDLIWRGGQALHSSAPINLDDDDYPELVGVDHLAVYAVDHDGQRLWGPIPIPQARGLGAPIVVNLDGVGLPEILVVSAGHMVALRADGSVFWDRRFLGESLSINSNPTAFDFDQNGVSEVVFQSSHTVFILDGLNGNTLMERAGDTWGFSAEADMPTVADIDLDGDVEIIATLNGGLECSKDQPRVGPKDHPSVISARFILR